MGDMILCVNKEEMVGADYDHATNILKKTEGVINMWVAKGARDKKGKKPGMCYSNSCNVAARCKIRFFTFNFFFFFSFFRAPMSLQSQVGSGHYAQDLENFFFFFFFL